MHGEYHVSDKLRFLLCELDLCIRDNKLDSWLNRLHAIIVYDGPFFADSILCDNMKVLRSEKLSGCLSDWSDDCRNRFQEIQYIIETFVEKSSK